MQHALDAARVQIEEQIKQTVPIELIIQEMTEDYASEEAHSGHKNKMSFKKSKNSATDSNDLEKSRALIDEAPKELKVMKTSK